MKALDKELKTIQQKDPHKFLKLCAKAFLLDKGFNWSEIHEEHCINSLWYNARVDVVGISEKKKVAIECGNTTKDRILLYLFFDEVYHLPYEGKKSLQVPKKQAKKVINHHIERHFDIAKAYLEEARKFMRLSPKEFYVDFICKEWTEMFSNEKES